MSTGERPRRGLWSRLTSSQTQVDAQHLEAKSQEHGAGHIRDCVTGERATITGRLRSVTIRPVSKSPAVEAELWDGTGRLTLVFLGRRQIPGITPGRQVVVHGRAIVLDGEPSMVNPRYELLPVVME